MGTFAEEPDVADPVKTVRQQKDREHQQGEGVCCGKRQRPFIARNEWSA